MDSALVTTLLLGFALGIEHALDADHVVAVSTIVSQNRHPLRAALVGVFWGIGHTTTLFLVGLAVIFFKLTIPGRVALSAEFLVGIVLVALGAQVIWRSRPGKIHLHMHDHDGDMPVHPHLHSHEQDARRHRLPHNHKSLLIGMVHGLAGSAALMLLVLGTVRSPFKGAAFILVFGAGSIIGMMLISSLISLPFAAWSRRFTSLHRIIRSLAGTVSIVLGVIVIYEIGFAGGLIHQL